MLNEKGFDLWAEGYDKSVGLSEEENRYPFAGYKQVLGKLYELLLQNKARKILDLGFGTAVLTSKLYQQGCEIFGQDFSAEMCKIARQKMPHAKLYQGDLTEGLVEELASQEYDAILASYALHHLTDKEKPTFIRQLQKRLRKGGLLLIGDIAFASASDQEACRLDAGESWDEEECYFVAENFPTFAFQQISHCAGILCWRKE